MRVGMVTSWPPTRCGIAEYSKNLVNSLEAQFGIDKLEVFDKGIKACRGPLLASGCDIIHFQNQGSFWSGEWFSETLKQLKAKGILTVVTWHDSAYWDGFDGFKYVDLNISHRQDILDAMPVKGHSAIMPMPIPEVKPRFCGYGLGRSKHEDIKEVCDRLGFIYEWQDPKSEWLDQAALIDWIKRYDGVILWYEDHGTLKGSSAGVRLAIAARRPIFLSKCDWFSDVVSGDFGVTKADDLGDLEDTLRDQYLWKDINKFFFSKAADLHYSLYKKLAEGSL